jgi:hypothetical protein
MWVDFFYIGLIKNKHGNHEHQGGVVNLIFFSKIKFIHENLWTGSGTLSLDFVFSFQISTKKSLPGKNFFLEISIFGVKRNFMLISDLKEYIRKSAPEKNLPKNCFFGGTEFFRKNSF